MANVKALVRQLPLDNEDVSGPTKLDLCLSQLDVLLKLSQQLYKNWSWCVVSSFMYALTGGSLRPDLMCYLPATHRDALMITSMAIVKASREMVLPAMVPTFRCCHAVV